MSNCSTEEYGICTTGVGARTKDYAYLPRIYLPKKTPNEMSKQLSKVSILSACIQKQQDLISDFVRRVEEMKADANEHSHSASQSENRTAGNIELLNSLQLELGFAQVEMNYLNTLKPDVVNEIAEPGAVVVTNKRSFFIAVSSENVEVEGQEIFGISTKAPLYLVMAGHKMREEFEYNGTVYKIEEVY